MYPPCSLGGHNLLFNLRTVQFNFKNAVFELRLIHCFILSSSQMTTTRKEKKTRKSRGFEMFSDIEKLDIMLGESHFNRNERDVSLNSNHAGRSESALGDECENDDENRSLRSTNVDTGIDVDCARNSASGNSSAEINRLPSEMNSRLSRELDEMMSSVNTQIERAISDAISSQTMPQIPLIPDQAV